jgi:hypothetical protein
LVVGGGVDLSTCTSCLTEYDDSREFGSIGVRSGKVNNQGKAINQSINQSIKPIQLNWIQRKAEETRSRTIWTGFEGEKGKIKRCSARAFSFASKRPVYVSSFQERRF